MEAISLLYSVCSFSTTRKTEFKILFLTWYFTLENSFLNLMCIMHRITEVTKPRLRDSELSYPKTDYLNKVVKYKHK